MGIARKILHAIDEGTFWEKSLRKTGQCLDTVTSRVLYSVTNLFSRCRPLDRKKVLFCNFKGGGYGCNPKYICEALHAKRPDLDIVWCTRNAATPETAALFPSWTRLVEYRSVEALIEHNTAGAWVDNQRKTYFIKKGLKKRDGQFYLQTFHGSLGIKKVGTDAIAEGSEEPDWIPYGKKDASWIDLLTSNSTFEDDIFSRCFFGNKNVKQTGHARNDIFFKDPAPYREKLASMFNLRPGTGIVLYVPSFRDTGRKDCYTMDYSAVIKNMRERFGGDWVMFVRFHPNLKKYADRLFSETDDCFNLTQYPDIQELLAAADAIITDYSSCMFDFLLTKRPGFIFASDSELFNNERGFYFPLEDTPFPVAYDNETLARNILSFDEKAFAEKAGAFLRGKGCMDDGGGAVRAADAIIEKLEGAVK